MKKCVLMIVGIFLPPGLPRRKRCQRAESIWATNMSGSTRQTNFVFQCQWRQWPVHL